MREIRPIIGNRSPCPGYPSKPIGLAVRKALSYAINREELKDVVLGDDYEIFHHPINPLNKSWLNPNIFKFCYNLQVARNYMQLPGYDIGWNYDWAGYPAWPNWEFVCYGTPTPTVSIDGFGLKTTILCLSISSVSFLLILVKRRKKNGD